MRRRTSIGIKHLGKYLTEDMPAMRTLGVAGLPTTLLIGRAGREPARLAGPAGWDGDQLARQIQAVIQQGRP